MKVLVVDDSPSVVEVFSAVLTLSGHVADEAYDGDDAVRHLQETSYDVVITDAQMPGTSGVEICKFLKARFPGVYIFCIAKPFRVRGVQEAVENRIQPVRA